MRSYFLIPPNIKLNNSECLIKGSITFLNYPNNFKKKNLPKIQKIKIYLGIFILINSKWILIDVKSCQYGDFLTLERSYFSVSDKEIIVVLTSSSGDFPKECLSLPEPYSLRIDNSEIAERVSFNMHFNSCMSSYQSEYPFEITEQKYSSFFSSDALKTIDKNNKIYNFLILMNLKRNAKNQGQKVIKLFEPNNINESFFFNARENDLSILDLSVLKDKKFYNDILFMTCKDCTFIPITLSLDIDSNQMKLEHTHPPSEMLSGNKKYKVTNLIKKNWLI